jgi:membrane-associated PAP2 superfamily phosphatase
MRRLAEQRSVARATFIVLVVLGIVTGIVFAVDPALDLEAAAFFGVPAAEPKWRSPSYALENLVTFAGIAPAVIALLIKMFRLKRPAPMSGRAALFLILTLAIGPGLIVNGLLKDGWGRPRPGMVTEFGGTQAFRPWWDPRGACHSNCSFVSGETSSAIWWAAPAVLAPPPWRMLAVGAALLYGAAIAAVRLLAGGHFLSDVIFAGIFTGLVIWTVHGALYRWPFRPEKCTIDRVLERIGSAITRLFGATARSNDAQPPPL